MLVNKRLTGDRMYAIPEKLCSCWVFYDKPETKRLLTA